MLNTRIVKGGQLATMFSVRWHDGWTLRLAYHTVSLCVAPFARLLRIIT